MLFFESREIKHFREEMFYAGRAGWKIRTFLHELAMGLIENAWLTSRILRREVASLVFSEKALIRWRSTFETDGATRFSETVGGLNQMTIAKFEELIAGSPLKFVSLELVPIRKLRRFHNRFTREFTTAVVRCRLVKREDGEHRTPPQS
jgi:hypothetical protein